MNVTIEDVSGCRKKMKVVLPPDRVNAEFEKVTVDFQKWAQIPGFRKGKAPKAMVLKKFSAEIDEETRRQLLPQAYREAVKEKNLQVVSAPRFEEVQFQRGFTLSFTSMVDVAPEFPLPPYKGLKVKKADDQVTDEDVKNGMESLLRMRAEFVNAEGRPVQAEDFAVVSYQGALDGKPLGDLLPNDKMIAAAEKFWIRMKDEEFFPGFVAQVTGMSVGEKRTVTVEFPADFRVKEVAGKKVAYEVELHEIKTQKLPELTDEMAKEFGQDNAEGVKTFIRETLVNRKKSEGEEAQRSEVIDQILKAVTFELPESWVVDETRDVIYNIVNENQQRGVAANVLEEKKQEIFENASKTAKDRVKFAFIVQKIADAEKIEVTQQDFANEILRLSKTYNQPAEELGKRFRDPDNYFQLHRQLQTRKVIDFVWKQAIAE